MAAMTVAGAAAAVNPSTQSTLAAAVSGTNFPQREREIYIYICVFFCSVFLSGGMHLRMRIQLFGYLQCQTSSWISRRPTAI